jgi:membrane-associated PAP2 superfamily phosphatase
LVRAIIATLAVVTGAVTAAMLMGIEVDLRVAELFFDPSRHRFFGHHDVWSHLRENGLVALVTCLGAVVTAVVTRLLRLKKEVISARAVLFLVSTLALGPGLLANVVLKDHWHRPRPVQVTQFGGKQTYVNWWDFHGGCGHNCSFVSGEVSSADWMFAPAMLTPPQWRVGAYVGAAIFTAAVAVSRMAVGRHFLTDTLLAALLTLILIYATHWLIFRWRPG